jgi:hypothetical protein
MAVLYDTNAYMCRSAGAAPDIKMRKTYHTYQISDRADILCWGVTSPTARWYSGC